MAEISIFLAFIAGIVSFLAPCVLPLIPGFLAYLAGTSLEEAKIKRKEVFINSLLFVLGFSIVFSLLGVLLNTILESVSYDIQNWLARIGGAIIIFFGLYLAGLIKIPLLSREFKFSAEGKVKSKYLTSLLFGFAFAVGWTPCVGPVLGSVLGLAATQPGSAFSLLLAYSLGLGIPFLLMGLFTAQGLNLIRKHISQLRYIYIIFGILMIILGILVFTQSLNLLANWDFLNNLLLK